MFKKIANFNNQRMFVTTKDELLFEIHYGGSISRATEYRKYDKNGITFFYTCSFRSYSTPEILTKEEIQADINRWLNDQRAQSVWRPEYLQRQKNGMVKSGFSIGVEKCLEN